MEERVKQRECVSRELKQLDSEEGVCDGRESPHLPCQNALDASTGKLPRIEISDADYRSLHFPCDALKE